MHKMLQTYVSAELPATQRNSPRLHHLYGQLQQNDGMSHRNPISSRSKHKNEQKNTHILAKSSVYQCGLNLPLKPNYIHPTINSQREECERTISQSSDFHNIQIAFQIHTKTLEGKLSQVLERLEKNEKEMEKLAKMCNKQNHTLKILSDFKEIKDIYAVFREQKNIQGQFNSKISQEISYLKQSIPIMKQQIQKISRNCENYTSIYHNSLKQLQKNLIHVMEKKLLNKLSEKKQQKNVGAIQDLKNETNELRSKLTQLQQKYFFNLPPVLSHIKHTSLSSIKSSESIPVTLSQTLQTKLGSVHNICKSVYYVDKNGYLLDQNQYYLLDDNNQMIKMQEQHWEKLKGICQVVVAGEK